MTVPAVTGNVSPNGAVEAGGHTARINSTRTCQATPEPASPMLPLKDDQARTSDDFQN